VAAEGTADGIDGGLVGEEGDGEGGVVVVAVAAGGAEGEG